jgi:hypothetical protein
MARAWLANLIMVKLAVSLKVYCRGSGARGIPKRRLTLAKDDTVRGDAGTRATENGSPRVVAIRPIPLSWPG